MTGAFAGNDVVFRVVQVERVSYDFARSTAHVVLRESEGARRAVNVPIALADATAVHHALHHTAARRPSSSELVISMLQEFHVDIIAARIVRWEEGIFYAELDVMTPRGRRVFDCRPSDAINLCCRQVVPAPVLVAEELLRA